MTGFDLSTISDCYIGSTQASEIYYSDTKVWPSVDYSREYLTIEPLANGKLTYLMRAASGNLYYSTDKQNWTSSSSGSINLTNGQNVYLKGNLVPKIVTDSMAFGGTINIDSDSNFNISGNIMSLLYGDNFIGKTSLSDKNSAFHALLQHNTYVVNAKNLVLPATILSKHCYSEMFWGCSSLKTAPKLPATTLAEYCYQSMFIGCSSLKTAPVLPAKTLVQYCYSNMFNNCTRLNYIKCLATNISARECTYYWTYQITGTGTFVKDSSMLSWTTGASGIPSGWTVHNV